jgi:GT2 family glycosyltransferase
MDNQTTDDSAEFTRQQFSKVKILSAPGRMGFGGANNYAMKQARGAFFLMINEDTEMDPDCVAECVRVMQRSDRIAVVAPKMKLFYMRDFYNSMGNSTHPNGQSHDNFIGYLDVGQFDDTDEVFTACFGAAMVRREAIERIGYMDEKYFVYYDDVDWSYRARIHGYDVVAAPRAIVYHKFNATVSTMASTFKLGLIVHNRLRFAWRNFDFRRARQFLWMYFEEDVGNFFWALSKREHDVARTYAKARLRWLLSWPEATYRRWQTRRARHADFSDDTAFALTEKIPMPSVYGRYPAIVIPFVRAHYMQLERFRPESPPAAEDLVPALGPMPAPSSHLVQKAWQTLKTGGMSGLVKETQNYLRWRFGSL